MEISDLETHKPRLAVGAPYGKAGSLKRDHHLSEMETLDPEFREMITNLSNRYLRTSRLCSRCKGFGYCQNKKRAYEDMGN